jgi:hypothetical protein
MAEGVGFEPTEPFGSPVFKTGAIDHSTTPPLGKLSESRGDMHSLASEIKEISVAGRSRREEEGLTIRWLGLRVVRVPGVPGASAIHRNAHWWRGVCWRP